MGFVPKIHPFLDEFYLRVMENILYNHAMESRKLVPMLIEFSIKKGGFRLSSLPVESLSESGIATVSCQSTGTTTDSLP